MKKKVSLTVLDGPDRGATFSFSDGGCHVGRGRGELTLSDKKISGKHFKVWVDGDKVMVEDLGSTNGTFLGGRRLEKAEALRNMDTIFAGLSKISVSILDDLSSFKEVNSEVSSISRNSAIIDVDDLDSSEDDELLGGLFEDSVSGAKPSKTAHVSPSDLASMIEDERTVQAKPESKAPVELRANPVLNEPLPERSQSPKTELPAEDAVYRDTGIQRISNLIKDELDTFSKWDDPKIPTVAAGTTVPKIKVRLKVRRGPEGTSSVDCTAPMTTFGRKDVDIRLNDLDVSRKHSAVEILNGDKVFVKDLGSTNGTFVNGKKVTRQEIQSGDLVQVGQTIFEVSIEGKKKG